MSPETPDVSVVIVTYNNENDIQECLSGLLSNINSSLWLQVLIIDNASHDNTIDTIENFKTSYTTQQLQILLQKNQQNLGFTAALNQGLKLCKGRYIMVLNPDASLQENCISTLIATLNSDQEVGIAAPQLRYSDGSIQPSCRRFPRRRDLMYELSGLSYLFPESPRFNYWKMADFNHDYRREVDQPQGACLFFARDLLEEVGFWDEAFPMFFSDVDWCARLKNRGYKIVFDPEAKAVHKKGTSIYRNRVKMVISSHQSFVLYLKKYRRNFILVNQIFAIILWIAAFVRILIFKTRDLLSRPNKKGN